MIEIFLFGIVLGLIPITLAGLFVTAYLQYRRGDQLDLWLVKNVWPPLIEGGQKKRSACCSKFSITHENKTRTESRSVGFEPTTLGFGDPRSAELN